MKRRVLRLKPCLADDDSSDVSRSNWNRAPNAEWCVDRHLHGHKFWLLGVGTVGMNRSIKYSEIQHRTIRPLEHISKDTTPVPAMGWALIRVLFDNPGKNALHYNC